MTDYSRSLSSPHNRVGQSPRRTSLATVPRRPGLLHRAILGLFAGLQAAGAAYAIVAVPTEVESSPPA
jgi:hypothetical protein